MKLFKLWRVDAKLKLNNKFIYFATSRRKRSIEKHIKYNLSYRNILEYSEPYAKHVGLVQWIRGEW